MTSLLDQVAPDRPDVDQELQELVCTGVVQVTHDVKSFILATRNARGFDFLAGQHLSLTVDVDGERVQRCYSVSSPADRSGQLTITVKRVPGGRVSGWLHDRLKVGDRVRTAGPFGRFTTSRHPAAAHLLLSAGSGITPLMSMARTLQDSPEPHDVVFVHSARTPADIIFRPELEAMGAPGSGLRVAVVCSADSPDEPWTGPRGRLTGSLLTQLVPDLTARAVFTCGPPAYRDAVRRMLDRAGVDPARCHEESFRRGDITAAEPPADDTAAGSDHRAGFAVEFRRSGRVVRCAPDSTILAAALRAGVRLPSSCGEGLCGTCKTTLLSGEVDMRHAGGIRPREIAADKILVCCSRPRADVVIDA